MLIHKAVPSEAAAVTEFAAIVHLARVCHRNLQPAVGVVIRLIALRRTQGHSIVAGILQGIIHSRPKEDPLFLAACGNKTACALAVFRQSQMQGMTTLAFVVQQQAFRQRIITAPASQANLQLFGDLGRLQLQLKSAFGLTLQAQAAGRRIVGQLCIQEVSGVCCSLPQLASHVLHRDLQQQSISLYIVFL